MRHARKYAEAIVETVQEPLLILDDRLSILTANRAFFEMLGTSPRETIGRSIYSLDGGRWNIPEVSDMFANLQRDGDGTMREGGCLRGSVRIGTKSFRLSVQLLRQRPRMHVILLAMKEMSDSDNTGEATDRQFADAENGIIATDEELGQQLIQRARLESIGLLAGGIAHDFNNLLVGILGNAGLALGEAPAGTPYQAALQDVISASQRAASLAKQLMSYVGKSALTMHPVNVSALVREIAKLIHSSIPRTVELQLNLSEELLPVLGDACQMEQIVMNLVINAAESIGEGKKGQVCVSTTMRNLGAADLRRHYGSVDLPPGPYVVLEVVDDGGGMGENTRKRLFDPFFTTKAAGRGLGLAAVKGIVQRHHGAITVFSTLGKGTAFEIVLPAIAYAAASLTQSKEIQDLHGTGLILLVDDEPLVLQIMRTTLELHGYRVLTAHNGDVGVQVVRDQVDELALVILDSTMPVMGGEAALGHMKALDPGLPVILTSGYDMPQAVSEVGKHQLAGFIRKPFMLDTFLGTVKSVIRDRVSLHLGNLS